jgi:hypothetical protein
MGTECIPPAQAFQLAWQAIHFIYVNKKMKNMLRCIIFC